MKVGILTFHEADNYGAVLQAYALQQVLKKLGAESEFISTQTQDAPSADPISGPASIFMKRIRTEGAKRAALFQQFRDRFMICSARYAKEELTKINDEYDLFIAGSDQIWNFRIPGADERYFLPFADPQKRVSYAASFGTEEFPEKAKPWCAKQLEQFKHLSVREESGWRIVRELIQKDAMVCLDPTLLLTREDWGKLILSDEEEPYVLLFMLKYDEELALRAKNAAAEAGVALKVVTAAFMPQYGFSGWSDVDVNDWIKLIAGAKGVFTNSFHGTVFSLLFGRPLSVARLGGELSKRNGRLEELLNRVGMERALCGEQCCMDADAFEKQIDAARQESLNYLKEVLSDAKVV